VALDPAAGRAYWSNSAGGGAGTQGISFANLDGSGGADLNTGTATLGNPTGVALDPAAGRIYWLDVSANVISFANLDGSGGGELNTGAATVNNPIGIALDPASRRIYWSNAAFGGGTQGISFANLDGSGGDDLNTAGATLANPFGVALDLAAGRIYWTNPGVGGGAQGISFAALDGSGGNDLPTPGAAQSGPVGAAVDPAAGRIYWANVGVGGGAQGISFAALDGSGGADLPTPGATMNFPVASALLKAPVGTGAPHVSGAAGRRSRLSCAQGSWAPDQWPSQLYRAPHGFAYQWSRNDKKIKAANASSYRPHAVGSYRCTVSAENQAGSSAQTSVTHVNFGFGQLIRNRRLGTAKLIVKVPRRGKVTLSAKMVKKQKRRSRLVSKAKHLHKASLRIIAKGAAKRRLQNNGTAKLKLKVAYRPKGGESSDLSRTVTLRLRGR
jgi:hypothetical protein